MSKIANLFYIREMYYATYSIKINITLMNVHLNAAVIFKGNGSYKIEKKKMYKKKYERCNVVPTTSNQM